MWAGTANGWMWNGGYGGGWGWVGWIVTAVVLVLFFAVVITAVVFAVRYLTRRTPVVREAPAGAGGRRRAGGTFRPRRD